MSHSTIPRCAVVFLTDTFRADSLGQSRPDAIITIAARFRGLDRGTSADLDALGYGGK